MKIRNATGIMVVSLLTGLLGFDGSAFATGGGGGDNSAEDDSGSNQSAQTQQRASRETVNLISDAIKDGIEVTIRAFRFPGSNVADARDGTPSYSFSRGSLRTDMAGASAGSGDSRFGVWANGGFATFDQDNAAIRSDGDVYTLSTGADWQFNDRLIVGLAVAYEHTDTTTSFNSGDVESDGYFAAPYFAAILGGNRNILWEGAIGYGVSENDINRNNGAITADFDSDRWLATTKLSYLTRYDEFAITPNAGLLWFENTNDAYTESGAGGLAVSESDSQLGRFTAGVRIDYVANANFIPYVTLEGEYDFKSEDYSGIAAGVRPPRDEFGARLGLGAQFRLSDAVALNVSGDTTLAREDYEAYSAKARVRFKF